MLSVLLTDEWVCGVFKKKSVFELSTFGVGVQGVGSNCFIFSRTIEGLKGTNPAFLNADKIVLCLKVLSWIVWKAAKKVVLENLTSLFLTAYSIA